MSTEIRSDPSNAASHPAHAAPPLVSLIMPVRNEQDFIARSLGAVLAQDYPRERLEIWVADGMSSDATRAVIGELVAHDAAAAPVSSPRVRVIDNPEGIVPTAMNRAMRLARGEVVVRVDGHCEVPRDYVSRAVALLARDGVAGVGGPVETLGSTYASRAISLAMSSAFGVGPGSFRTAQSGEREADTVPFPAYRRAAIETAGPYDEELVRNQDDEYNYRLRKLGFRLLLSPSLTSRYYGRSSFRGLARQYAGYGFWKVRVLQKHPRQMMPRQFAPPLAVAGCGTLLAAALVSPTALVVLAALLVAYGLAAGIAATTACRSAGARPWPGVVASYALMHGAYGAGFVAGLWRFRRRWPAREAR